jgi:hypothetical protein
MNLIKELLSKYQSLKVTNQDLKDQLILLIKNKTQFTLSNNQIKINNQTVYLQVPPIIKTEVLINKQELLHLLQEQGFNVLDIK